MSVTVVSCVYGDYHRFMDRWLDAIWSMEPRALSVFIADDHVTPCTWKHSQAFYLQHAIEQARTDWVWISDIDDLPHPDALAGLEDVQADVWQMGFDRSDGERYIPPTLTAEEVLAMDRNVLVGSSAIRTEAFHAAGGFPDIALQDWGLWRRLARNGATFQSSGRTHFRYMRHDAARGTVELTANARAAHLAEMMESELAVV